MTVENDSLRVQKILKSRGYYVTKFEAKNLWKRYSNSMVEEWIDLPEDDFEVFSRVVEYVI